MHPHRRGDVPLERLLGFVLGVFLEFHIDVAMYRLGPAAARDEVVAVHAQFQRALVAVEERRPRVVRVGRVAPGAVLPDDLQVVEVKACCLCVGGVGLGLFVDENAAL